MHINRRAAADSRKTSPAFSLSPTRSTSERGALSEQAKIGSTLRALATANR
jgi:hypothetical protein